MQISYHIYPGLNFVRTPQDILVNVCETLNISVADISGRSRNKRIVDARQIYFYIAKKKTEFTLREIGMLINRGHSDVIHHLKRVDELLSINDRHIINNLKMFNL